MSATAQPLFIEQGAPYTLGLTWTDGDLEDIGDPVPVTAAWMQVRKSDCAPAMIDVSSQGVDPRITVDSDTGGIIVALTGLDTQMLSLPESEYDLWAQVDDAEPVPLMYGKVRNRKRVTEIDG